MYETRTNKFLTAVAAEIKTWIPELKTCEVHNGRFDKGELMRHALRAPAVLVSCLGTASVEDRGDEGVNAQKLWAAFIVTRDLPGLPRGEGARNLADALELLIMRGIVEEDPITKEQRLANRWGLKGVGPAEQLRSQNLYGGDIDKQGAALWVVSWRQSLRIRPLSRTEDCPIPSQVYLGQAPEIGAGHEADYERVS